MRVLVALDGDGRERWSRNPRTRPRICHGFERMENNALRT